MSKLDAFTRILSLRLHCERIAFLSIEESSEIMTGAIQQRAFPTGRPPSNLIV